MLVYHMKAMPVTIRSSTSILFRGWLRESRNLKYKYIELKTEKLNESFPVHPIPIGMAIACDYVNELFILIMVCELMVREFHIFD